MTSEGTAESERDSVKLLAELEHVRQLLRSIEAGVTDYILLLDLDGTIRFINRTVPGLTVDQVVGTTVFRWMPSAYHERVRQTFARVVASGEPDHYEVDYHGPDGSVRVFESRVGAILSDGQVSSLAICSSDVTSHHEAERELRSSHARWKSLAQSLPDTICTVDREGLVLFSNRSAPGLGPFQGTRLHTLLAPGSQRDLDRCLAAVFGGRGDQQAELAGALAHSWLQVRATPFGPLSEAGVPDVVLVVLTDVTTRRSLQRQLAQSQKMEAVGCLAGSVAHDFNNLLMVIAGHADLLVQQGASPELTAIREAAEQAAALTGQLLALSARANVRPQPVDLRQVLQNCEGLLRRTLGSAAELLLELPDGPLSVEFDPHQARQLLLNLCLNARDALPDGGQIRLRVGRAPDGRVELSVRDNGVGMSAAVRARIFEPFFTTKALGRGTGLGLASVQSAVDAAGGTIEVESAEGQGSCFRVLLPASAEAPVRERDESPPIAPPAGAGTILLVEDEPAVRDLVARVLRRNGYTVLVASRPSEALKLWSESGASVDLLLTDLVLPEMSGRQLATLMLAERPDLSVIYQSGFDPSGDLPGLEGKGSVFLGKPFTPSRLLAAVQGCLNARS